MGRPVNALNLIKITKGNINSNYVMSIDNVFDIENGSKDTYDLIYNAFVFGYAQGTKAQKKGRAYNV